MKKIYHKEWEVKLLSHKFSNKDKQSIGLITYLDPNSSIAEQYRMIRTNIQFLSFEKEMKSIVITSPEPADGKSTTATNLAITLSQLGKKVLLIDADLRKPSIHYTFNISNIDGLTSVLTQKTRLEDAVTKTYIPNLEVLTSGIIPPNPSELLDSKTMESLMLKLKHSFDYIIFDTPPILAVTDSQVIANKCDGAVMVMTSGRTRKDKALKAKKLLDMTNSPLLGVILNKVDYFEDNYYYQHQ